MVKDQSEVTAAIRQICEEKNISYDSVIETIESALAVAYRKDYGEKTQNIKAIYKPETGKMEVFDLKEVAEDKLYEGYLKEEEERQKEREKPEAEDKTKEIKKEVEEESASTEATADKRELEGDEEEKEKRFNPKTMMPLKEAKKIKKTAKVGDEIKIDLPVHDDFGRVAAQTAKQVIIQKIREAEREVVYQEYKDREGEIVVGAVQRTEGRTVLVDLGHATAIMPMMEQVQGETYSPGQRVKVYLVSASNESRGPEVIVSRAHPDVLRKLFMTEVPEINSGLIEIKAVAREAGQRSKVAVSTDDENIDPIGSCVGQRGARIQTIIGELGGEKIDIIEWQDDSDKFIKNALSPAKVIEVKTNKEGKIATVVVKEDQLSLAIGKAGQNVRLAAKLTGWKIDIVQEGEEKKKDQDKKDEKEDHEDTEKKKDAKHEDKEDEKKKETKDVKENNKKDKKDKKDEKDEGKEDKELASAKATADKTADKSKK